MKIDWKRKLSSRKFWLTVGEFVTCLVVFINSPDKTAQITSLVVSGGAVISYVIGESITDAASIKANEESTNEKE